MNRTLLRLLPIPVIAAAVAVGVLLATQRWEGDDPSRQAQAAPAAMALCSVAIADIPEGVEVFEYPIAAALDQGMIYLFVGVPTPDGELSGHDPASGRPVRKGFQAIVDARTGDIIDRFEDRSLPAKEAAAAETKLDEALGNLVPLESAPAFSAWPRTDTPPAKQTDTFDEIKYQPPDAGAGLIVERINAAPPGGGRMIVRTCDSKVTIDRLTKEQDGVNEIRLTRHDVVAEEQEMFDRFLDAVEGLQR